MVFQNFKIEFQHFSRINLLHKNSLLNKAFITCKYFSDLDLICSREKMFYLVFICKLIVIIVNSPNINDQFIGNKLHQIFQKILQEILYGLKGRTFMMMAKT